MRAWWEARFRFEGNERTGRGYIPTARKLLGQVDQLDRQLGGLEVSKRTLTLDDGTVIQAEVRGDAPPILTINTERTGSEERKLGLNSRRELRTVWEPEGLLITPRSESAGAPYGWGFPKRESATGDKIDPPFGTPIAEKDQAHLREVLINRYANNKYLDDPKHIGGVPDDMVPTYNLRLRDKLMDEPTSATVVSAPTEAAPETPRIIRYKRSADDEGNVLGEVAEDASSLTFDTAIGEDFNHSVEAEPFTRDQFFKPWVPFFEPAAGEFWREWRDAPARIVTGQQDRYLQSQINGTVYPELPGLYELRFASGDSLRDYAYFQTQAQFVVGDTGDVTRAIHEPEGNEWIAHWPQEELYTNPLSEAIFQRTNELRADAGQEPVTRPVRGNANTARLGVAEVSLSRKQHHVHEAFRSGYESARYRYRATGEVTEDLGENQLITPNPGRHRAAGVEAVDAWAESAEHLENIIEALWSKPPGATALSVADMPAIVDSLDDQDDPENPLRGKEITQFFEKREGWLYAGTARWTGNEGTVSWYAPAVRYFAFFNSKQDMEALESQWVVVQGRKLWMPDFGPVIGAALARRDGILYLRVAIFDGYETAETERGVRILAAPLSAVAKYHQTDYRDGRMTFETDTSREVADDPKAPFDWELEGWFPFEEHYFGCTQVSFDSEGEQCLFAYATPGDDVHDDCYRWGYITEINGEEEFVGGNWGPTKNGYDPVWIRGDEVGTEFTNYTWGSYSYNPRVPHDSRWVLGDANGNFSEMGVDTLEANQQTSGPLYYETSREDDDGVPYYEYTVTCNGSYRAVYDFEGTEVVSASIRIEDDIFMTSDATRRQGGADHPDVPSRIKQRRTLVFPSGQELLFQNYDWESRGIGIDDGVKSKDFLAGSYCDFFQELDIVGETYTVSRVLFETETTQRYKNYWLAAHGKRALHISGADGENPIKQQNGTHPLGGGKQWFEFVDHYMVPQFFPPFWENSQWRYDFRDGIYRWAPFYDAPRDEEFPYETIRDSEGDCAGLRHEPFRGPARVGTFLGFYHANLHEAVYVPWIGGVGSRRTFPGQSNFPDPSTTQECGTTYRSELMPAGMEASFQPMIYEAQTVRYNGAIVYCEKMDSFLGNKLDEPTHTRWANIDLSKLTQVTDLDDNIFPLGIV